jgi:adenine-specific DNA-methyltransferase
MVRYKNLSDARRHGVYYTPSHLANFLVKPLINKSNISILDPAYGEGSLLLAAEDIIKRKRIGTNHLELYGCDRAPVNGRLKHFKRSHLIETDFFDYDTVNRFDLIVMNPPFVRHHLIPDEDRKKYQIMISEACCLKWSSDLWAYFLVKACFHLKRGGDVGIILPWSFLQADYAQEIRIWLADNFKEISLQALSSEYFADAQERVVLVWLRKYGFSATSIKIAFSQRISDNVRYSEITRERWTSKIIVYSDKYDVSSIISEYIENFKFKRFEEVARIKIGIVTGADKYFILGGDDQHKGLFPDKYLQPIFTSFKEFSGLYLNGNKPTNSLITLPANGAKEFKNFIIDGVKARYHLRAHSLRREPWYSVDKGDMPSAFFPYRVSRIPYLVLNDQGAQCTNSIHRIYFKKSLSASEKKWLQISLLSVPGQLSLEAHSRTYGSVLKIEPKALKHAIAYICRAKSIDKIYNTVSDLLAIDQKVEAMQTATDFINKTLGIPAELSAKAYFALMELHNRRLRR